MIWLGIGLGFGARDLPRADARRRQRAAWVLGRAWEVEFCDHAERAGPAWLTPEDIEQVKRHAASLGIKCEPLREASGRYSRPVDLPRRLVTRARQLEHELTVALRAGDAGVAEVVERWTDSELGWTDRLAEVLRELPARESAPTVHRLEAGATGVVTVDASQRLQHTVDFTDESTPTRRAKPADYMLRLVNSRGETGPWSETATETIGA
jgi:hypothetical protein